MGRSSHFVRVRFSSHRFERQRLRADDFTFVSDHNGNGTDKDTALASKTIPPAAVEADSDDLDPFHSRMLDVHTWSDHPEVNAFIKEIYDAHFSGGKTEIKKKHLKVVLLDLYVAWCEDPTRKIAYSRNSNDYDAGSRYNELHISRLTIKVIDRLVEAGLLDHKLGLRSVNWQGVC